MASPCAGAPIRHVVSQPASSDCEKRTARRSTDLSGFARGSLSRHGQSNLAAERGKARIVLVTQDEGIVEEGSDIRVAVAQGSIEPLEGGVRIIAQRVDTGDLKSVDVGILVDQRSESFIGCAAVVANLPRERERIGLPLSGRFLLRRG